MGPADASALLEVMREASDAVGEALADHRDWGLSRLKPGQYHHDLAADRAALEILHRAGLSVLSEESGRSGDGPVLVVIDPVDGSTNASRGVPWWATSLCAVDEQGPCAALVVNRAAGTRYEAIRGKGAWRDGQPIEPSGCQRLREAIVGLGDHPRQRLGWAQFRAFGAAALEICAVADGTLDAFCIPSGGRIFAWDYLGAMLVCLEAGAPIEDGDGKPLVVGDGSPRRPLAAATAELMGELRTALRSAA